MKDATIEDRQNLLRSCWARGPYDGADLQPATGIEPGRMRAYALPSRVGDRLYWPDGRVTDLHEKEPAA